MEDNVELKNRLLGITAEVGGGVATDWGTSWLLGFGPWGWAGYGAANFGQGAYTNYLVQKHLYGKENIKWGEVWASGGMSMIPFTQLGASAKAAKYVGKAGSVKRGFVAGAGVGLAGEQLRVGIDDKRWLGLGEATLAAGIGGGLGGGLHALITPKDQLGKGIRVHKSKQALKGKDFFGRKVNKKPVPGGQLEKAYAQAEELGDTDYSTLKTVLGSAISSEDYQPRAAAINTVNTNIKGVAAKLNHTAIELGYVPPSTDDAFIKKLIKEGHEPSSGMIKLRKPPKKHPNIPDDVYTLYTAHQRAYWDHIQSVQISTPGAKIDMRSFPDLIHDGVTYRPDPHQITIKEGPDAGKKVLKWTGIKDRNERMSASKAGRTKRLDQLKELNTYSGSSTGRWLKSKKSLVDELNDRLVAEGKHPIGELESISASDLHGDHRFPVDFTQAFGDGLSDEYKRIVYGHIVRAGGYLGDEIDNVVILNKAINIRKQSKLKELFKKRNHKPAQSFGEFIENETLQTEAQQRARVEYYTTPSKTTGLTPIEEFVEDVYMAEKWAEEQMDIFLTSLERIFPEELDKLPPEKRKIIREIFDGDWKAVKAFVGRLREWEAEGMPTERIQEMIDDEMWYRLLGKFK